jgi:hypothetical protein
MRKIQFKREGDTINCGGQVIHQGNITPEKYDELVKIAPAHADHFDVIDEEVEEKPAKPVKPSKPAADEK